MILQSGTCSRQQRRPVIPCSWRSPVLGRPAPSNKQSAALIHPNAIMKQVSCLYFPCHFTHCANMSAESGPHSPKTAFATTEPLMTLTTKIHKKRQRKDQDVHGRIPHTHTHTQRTFKKHQTYTHLLLVLASTLLKLAKPYTQGTEGYTLSHSHAHTHSCETQ